ncbi:ATPase, partial [Mycobacterium sp. CBMA361]|nr:ATPase [Mycolicibacterium sp. CBMA 361]
MTSPSGPPESAGGYPGPASTQGFPPAAHAAAPQPTSATLQSEVHTLERAIFEVKRIIVGQDLLVERMLVGLLAK